MAKIPKVIFFAGCNFVDYPIGGVLSFARNVIKVFGSKLALVGVSTDETPVGQWVQKEIDGICYHFFSIGKRNCNSARKSFVPVTLRTFCALLQHKDSILSIGIRSAFAGGGLSFVAVSNWSWDSFCGSVGGIRNPFDRPRYWYGRAFAPLWSKWRLDAMKKADVVLVRADDGEIDEYVNQTKGQVDRTHVVHFPTRVDTDIFKPECVSSVREQLSLDKDVLIIVTCGRISWVKGWDLILNTLSHLIRKRQNVKLVFVGDGEDTPKLQIEIQKRGLVDCVLITGFCNREQVAAYLNAANVFVMGSHFEGWPTAMVEALACGKPIVSTDISAASTLVIEGQNGYVVKNRDPIAFAEAIERASELTSANHVSLRLAERYALKYLARDLSQLWPVLAD